MHAPTHRSFSPALQTVGEISGDIQLNNIISKLVLLTLKFTDLRILWSRSSYATVELFKVPTSPIRLALFHMT